MNSDHQLKLFNEALACVQYKNDEGKIQELINQGLEVDRKDEFDYSLAERAIFGAINYSALYALWKAKARPTTEYVQEIFEGFELGKTVAEFYEEEAEELKRQEAKDITKDFTIKKLCLASTSFELTKEEFELTLVLKPFIYDDHFTETTLHFVGTCDASMSEQLFSTNGYSFKQDEIEPSSIYLQHVHNPVDLKKLRIKKGRTYNYIMVDLFFDFEYEQTDFNNEAISWESKVN